MRAEYSATRVAPAAGPVEAVTFRGREMLDGDGGRAGEVSLGVRGGAQGRGRGR